MLRLLTCGLCREQEPQAEPPLLEAEEGRVESLSVTTLPSPSQVVAADLAPLDSISGKKVESAGTPGCSLRLLTRKDQVREALLDILHLLKNAPLQGTLVNCSQCQPLAPLIVF